MPSSSEPTGSLSGIERRYSIKESSTIADSVLSSGGGDGGAEREADIGIQLLTGTYVIAKCTYFWTTRHFSLPHQPPVHN